MPAVAKQQQAPKRRGLCFNLAPAPSGLFVASEEIQVQTWDPFCPVWGQVVKGGIASQFDEVTYAQMLDDLVARNLRVYMDQDHATAGLGWNVEKVPALAYYCCVQVNHAGKVWRKENLAGHTCADAHPLDPAACPEGLYAFRCNVTPYGRQELPNYQALSIHFDPFGEDMQGRPVGQVLICVSAVNGPQVPGATPAGGQFNRSDDMKKRKLFALAKDEGGAEGDAPETKDLSVEMAELCKELGLPEGSAPESIIGAALATVKAGKPHTEPDGDEEPPVMAEEMPEAMKYTDDMPAADKGYARQAALRFSAARRAVVALSKELGTKPSPVAVLKGFAAFKARSVDSTEFAKVKAGLDALQAERAEEKAADRKSKIEALFSKVGPDGAGLLSSAKIEELRGQAEKFGASPEDVAAWLPKVEDATFTQGGAPKGKGGPAGGKPASDRVANADQASDIAAFKAQFAKDSGKKIKHDIAGQIVGRFYQRGEKYDYAKAKAEADRLPVDAFLKEVK